MTPKERKKGGRKRKNERKKKERTKGRKEEKTLTSLSRGQKISTFLIVKGI